MNKETIEVTTIPRSRFVKAGQKGGQQKAKNLKRLRVEAEKDIGILWDGPMPVKDIYAWAKFKKTAKPDDPPPPSLILNSLARRF